MLILIKPSISLYDAGNSVRKMHYCLGAKMKSPFNQRCCFLLFMLAIKTCSIEANTTLAFERGATGQNWVPFLFDIHGLNSIFRGKNGCIAAYFIIFLPNWIFPADWRVCFQVLVVYCCLMCKLGYVPYTHKTWSHKIFHNIYIYI